MPRGIDRQGSQGCMPPCHASMSECRFRAVKGRMMYATRRPASVECQDSTFRKRASIALPCHVRNRSASRTLAGLRTAGVHRRRIQVAKPRTQNSVSPPLAAQAFRRPQVRQRHRLLSRAGDPEQARSGRDQRLSAHDPARSSMSWQPVRLPWAKPRLSAFPRLPARQEGLPRRRSHPRRSPRKPQAHGLPDQGLAGHQCILPS